MNAEQIISMYKNNMLKPGWAVFQYNYNYAVSRIIGRLLFSFLFFGVSIVFLFSSGGDNTQFLILAGITALFSVVPFLSAIPVFFELFYSKNNFLIFEDEGIVKCFKGTIEHFPYDSIANIKFTNPSGASTPAIARKGEQYIDFTDKRNNKFVNLTKNRIFGVPENIYNLLLTKLPLENRVSQSGSYSSGPTYFNN